MSANRSIRPRRIGVIGAGVMGRGIARQLATHRFSVTLIDRDRSIVEESGRILRADLERAARLGNIEETERDSVLECIRTDTDLGAVHDAEIVIEAVPEILELKRNVLSAVFESAHDSAVLATNTSALPIAEIARGLSAPERIIGMHFFNPVHRMDLIEVVRSRFTNSAVEQQVLELCADIERTAVRVVDSPGFVTSRINVLIGNEACRVLESNIATPEDIDIALTQGLRHPMGPLALLDLVGLDVRASVLADLERRLGDRYRPARILTALVAEGRLGKKSGHGIYRYSDGVRVPGSWEPPVGWPE